MIGNASYRSFLVRLWREPGAEGDAWRGEVEHIQSGGVVAVVSLEAALRLIRRAVTGDEQRDGEAFDCHSETPIPWRV